MGDLDRWLDKEFPVRLRPFEVPPELNGRGFTIGFGAYSPHLDSYKATTITHETQDSLGGRTVGEARESLTSAQHHADFDNSGGETGGLLVFDAILGVFKRSGQAIHHRAAAGSAAPRSYRPWGATSVTAGIGRSRAELEYDKIDDGTPSPTRSRPTESGPASAWTCGSA